MCKRQLLFYGWFIVATGMVITAMGYGARYSFSVIFPALLDDFQWSRDVTAAMLSVHLLIYGFVAPVARGLADKIEPRRTMVFGVMLLASGLALSGWASEPWHFYLSYGVLSGIGLCLAGAVPFTVIVGKWFERRRGLAFSLLFSGAGLTVAFYPVVAKTMLSGYLKGSNSVLA